MALDVEILNTEKARLKESLRDIEAEQRKLEAKLKALRQDELKVKREIEALATLVELNEARQEPPAAGGESA